MQLAWHTAALALMGINGKFPDLEELLSKPASKEPASQAQLHAAAVAWLGPPPKGE